MEQFYLRIIAPTGICFQGEVEMAEFSTTDGEIGVYAGHIPLTVLLKEGVIRVQENGKKQEWKESGGFAMILPDSVTAMIHLPS